MHIFSKRLSHTYDLPLSRVLFLYSRWKLSGLIILNSKSCALAFSPHIRCMKCRLYINQVSRCLQFHQLESDFWIQFMNNSSLASISLVTYTDSFYYHVSQKKKSLVTKLTQVPRAARLTLQTLHVSPPGPTPSKFHSISQLRHQNVTLFLWLVERRGRAFFNFKVFMLFALHSSFRSSFSFGLLLSSIL